MCRHPLVAVTAHHECYAGRQAGLLLFAGAGRLREHSEVKSDLVAGGAILDGYLSPIAGYAAWFYSPMARD